MPDDNKMVRLSPEVHTELRLVAENQKQQVGTMADALLEFAMASPDRIDAALSLSKERGMKKIRTRRGGDGSWEPN